MWTCSVARVPSNSLGIKYYSVVARYAAHGSSHGCAGTICSDGAVVCARLAAVVKRWPRSVDLSFGVSQTFSHFFSKVAGAGRNRNCRNISRNLPVVSGAGRFDVGPRAGFGQVLAFWPVLASFASNNFRVVAIS